MTPLAIVRHRSFRLTLAAGSAVVLLAACGGTRLPNSAFAPYSLNAGGAGTGPGAAGGGGSTGSGAGLGSSGPAGSGGGLGGTASGPGTSGGGGAGSGPNGAGGGGGGGGGGGKSKGSGGGAANTASDRGVTPTQITVCNVVTQGGPFGPYQFTPSYYGAAAYFAALNAKGGVNGRTIRFVSHPDDGSDSGDLTQIHTCIDQDNAFAFVANDIYQYAGASYANSKDVPDIGGQPISTAYFLYPHLYTILGDHVPRNGKTLGLNGYQYRFDENALYFKQKQHVTHAGVVYYDQSSSQYGANQVIQEFKTAGVKVSTYQVNLGLPNFSSAVAQMKADGVDLVTDLIDLNGSQKLCQAIEQNSAFLKQMKVKLSTIADWTQSLGNDLSSTPGCLAKSWSDSYSQNFADTRSPQVAAFEAAVHKYFPGSVAHNHQFALEGYAAAEWFTDAVRSCGAKVTRSCVEKFMNRQHPFTVHGLMERNVGFDLKSAAQLSGTQLTCVSAAQWSRSANTWVTRASLQHDCYRAKGFKFALTAPT